MMLWLVLNLLISLIYFIHWTTINFEFSLNYFNHMILQERFFLGGGYIWEDWFLFDHICKINWSLFISLLFVICSLFSQSHCSKSNKFIYSFFLLHFHLDVVHLPGFLSCGPTSCSTSEIPTSSPGCSFSIWVIGSIAG